MSVCVWKNYRSTMKILKLFSFCCGLMSELFLLSTIPSFAIHTRSCFSSFSLFFLELLTKRSHGKLPSSPFSCVYWPFSWNFVFNFAFSYQHWRTELPQQTWEDKKRLKFNLNLSLEFHYGILLNGDHKTSEDVSEMHINQREFC